MTAKSDRPRVRGEIPDSTRFMQNIPRELIKPEFRPADGRPLGMEVTPKSPAQPAPAKASRRKSPAARADLPELKPTADKGVPSVEKRGPEKPAKADKGDAGVETAFARKKVLAPKTTRTPGKGKTKTPKPSPEKSPVVANEGVNSAPKPRPRMSNAGTSGPLGVSLAGTNVTGTLAIDSNFSRMGEYSQRMSEIIQAAWWAGADRSRISETGRVVIEFTLNKDGSVTGAHIVEKTTSDRAAYLCLDAIVGRAPFDEWPDDMIQYFGDKQSGRFTFYYR